MQKCTLEKKLVKKVHPDPACRKVPKEVCAPNNCKMEAAEEVCKDEARVQVQNVPEEECDLQPEETCHMEAVLVPRYISTYIFNARDHKVLRASLKFVIPPFLPFWQNSWLVKQ